MKQKTQLHPDSELINQFGGSTALAKRLGLVGPNSVQRVQNWKKRGIPLAIKIQFAELFLPKLLTISSKIGKQMEK